MKTTAECSRDRFSFEERRVAVQKCRKISGLTQAELAHLAKVSQSKVSQFENGDQDLGEEAFLRVEEALVEAMATRKAEVAMATRLLPLRSMLHAGPKKPRTLMEQIETEIKDGLLTGVRT
jgi:transcriptional regulator with XRE-family HTH domain